LTATRILQITAWLLLIGLAIVTIGPIQFRPVSPLPTQLERSLALAVIGFVFALAYPRRLLLVIVLVVGATTLFEALQLVEPSRHGRLVDVAVKLIGGGFGVAAGNVLNRLRRHD
jgi:hypothetical protein